MNICVYGAASNSIDKIYIEKCEELGFVLAKSGHSLIFGGGAGGAMGASARGATKGGGKIYGIVPSFFNVDGVLYDKCTEIIYTETMRIRKHNLEERSDAFVIAPGGIGTLDEFFEILTLKSLGRHTKPMAVFNVNGFYDNMLEMIKKSIKEGFIKEQVLDLIFVSDNAEEIIGYIENELK